MGCIIGRNHNQLAPPSPSLNKESTERDVLAPLPSTSSRPVFSPVANSESSTAMSVRALPNVLSGSQTAKGHTRVASNVFAIASSKLLSAMRGVAAGGESKEGASEQEEGSTYRKSRFSFARKVWDAYNVYERITLPNHK